MEKIIILMSTYNGEKFIREQIDSILLQTHGNFELLVRDDGSTDGTIKVLDEYKKAGKLHWYKGENLKPARSFLDLVKNAPLADYYAFCDQDDIWDPDKIEVAIKMIAGFSKEEPALYCSATRLVDENLKIITPVAHCKDFKLKFGEALVQAVSPGCTFVFNKKCSEYLSAFEADYISMHDALTYKIATAFGNVFYDRNPHISYRQHGGNVIGTEHSKIKIFKRRLKRFIFTKEPNSRYRMACAIEQNFGDIMDKESQEILKLFTGYKKSFIAKLKLIFSKNIRMTNNSDNFFFKILVLLGKV